MNLSSVDIGNYKLKAIFESRGKEERLEIPNVIAEIGESRDTVKFESDPLDGLHVEVTSRALAKGKGFYAVGNLAAKYPNNDELKADSEKGKSDQAIILLLTALAVHAVKNEIAVNDVVDVTYTLSTGLPLNEAKKKGARKAMKEKLLSSEHVVKFLDTPEFGGKTIRIKFDDVIVSSEGQAATIELTTNADGSLKNTELAKMTYMVHDIGGLSTDTAVIEPNGEVDNINSTGVKEGVSVYLDKIIKEVKEVHNYTFRSRKELEEIIVSESDTIRGHIMVKGNRTSIQDIIDKHLTAIAREQYKIINDVWNNVSAIQKAFIIGGGAVILKRYITDINREGHQYPLEFFPAQESVWMIVQSYMKILKFYLAQKQSV